LYRGTYTTQAKGKRENRKSEILMREAEYAATIASLVDSSYEYPKKVRIELHASFLRCRNSMLLGKIYYFVNSTMSSQEVVSPWYVLFLRHVDYG
jgi:alpha-mannosidase